MPPHLCLCGTQIRVPQDSNLSPTRLKFGRQIWSHILAVARKLFRLVEMAVRPHAFFLAQPFPQIEKVFSQLPAPPQSAHAPPGLRTHLHSHVRTSTDVFCTSTVLFVPPRQFPHLHSHRRTSTAAPPRPHLFLRSHAPVFEHDNT